MAGVRTSPLEALSVDWRFRTALAWSGFKQALRPQWRFPDPQSATAFDEMTLRDIYYWVHKCRHPVLHPERGVDIDAVINRNGTTLSLPEGFVKKTSLTFGAGGDLLYAPGLEHAQDVLFEDVAPLLFGCDISYANFESPVTDGPLVEEVISNKAAPVECCHIEQFAALCTHKGHAFSILNTANNHMADMGVAGIVRTQQALRDYGIVDTGTNPSPAEYGKAHFIERDGIRIGLVSVTFGLNDKVLPTGDEYRLNVSTLLSKTRPPDLDLLKRQIDDCRDNGCDLVLVSLHWGYEFEFFPRLMQIDLAHEIAEYGADLIIGHHPHVVQPVEYYRTKRDPDRIVPIAYSLGSLTWGYSDAHLALSAILNVTIAKGERNGEPTTLIESAAVTPVFRHYFERDGRQLATLRKVRSPEFAADEAPSAGYLDRIRSYADRVFPPQFA